MTSTSSHFVRDSSISISVSGLWPLPILDSNEIKRFFGFIFSFSLCPDFFQLI